MISNFDAFMMECHQVCFKKVAAITGLRARSVATGLALKDMRLIASACSVDVVKDGKELKVVPMF